MSDSIEAEPKPKKERSEKQIAAFAQAREARMKKLAEKKGQQPEVQEVTIKAKKNPQAKPPKIVKYKIEQEESEPEPESESEPEVEPESEPVKKVKKIKSVPEPRAPVKVEKFGYDNFVLFN